MSLFIRALLPALLLPTLAAASCADDKQAVWAAAETAYYREDYADALPYYLALALENDDEALERLGLIYEYGGHGLKADYAAARDWYEKAGAYRALARLYQNGGPGLPADWAEARRWLEMAAKAGDSQALLAIGALYEQGGPGLERNWAEARRWYEAAIIAGQDYGHWAIAQLYRHGGPGLEQNRLLACQYYGRAQAAYDNGPAQICALDNEVNP